METVRIEAPANIVYDLTNEGYIKAKDIMKVLYDLPKVTKKRASVMSNIENCLFEGREIKKAQYDMLTNEIVLTVSDLEWHYCTSCHRGYEGYPAISRKDNETEICPECGNKEALNEWVTYKMIQKYKEEYPEGTRIKLIDMADDKYAVESNMLGTVDHVDDAGTIHCNFDNGRTLGIIPGVDTFRKIEEYEDN